MFIIRSGFFILNTKLFRVHRMYKICTDIHMYVCMQKQNENHSVCYHTEYVCIYILRYWAACFCLRFMYNILLYNMFICKTTLACLRTQVPQDSDIIMKAVYFVLLSYMTSREWKILYTANGIFRKLLRV